MDIKKLNEEIENILNEKDINIIEPYIIQVIDLTDNEYNIILQNEHTNIKDAIVDFIDFINKYSEYYIEIVNHDSNDILISTEDLK